MTYVHIYVQRRTANKSLRKIPHHILSFPLPYAPLLDPGVLNCDESRSLRGVDMLLASSAGSGDISLPAELWKKKTSLIAGVKHSHRMQSFQCSQSIKRKRLVLTLQLENNGLLRPYESLVCTNRKCTLQAAFPRD